MLEKRKCYTLWYPNISSTILDSLKDNYFISIRLKVKETKENLAYDIEEVKDVKENANVKLTIVRPDYRGNGLQRVLINKLVEHAKEHGFKWTSSTASPVNTWSCNNLRACGFKEVKVLEKYGGLKRILFAKQIG